MSGTLFSFIIIYEAERLYKSEFTKKNNKMNAVSVTEVFFLAWKLQQFKYQYYLFILAIVDNNISGLRWGGDTSPEGCIRNRGKSLYHSKYANPSEVVIPEQLKETTTKRDNPWSHCKDASK